MQTPYSVTRDRLFTKVEKMMIWQKPASHQTGEIELRLASEIKNNWDDPELKVFNVLLEGDAGSGKTEMAKALSYHLQLPYTKVTCFADMDKSDVFGALLPVVAADDEEDSELLEAIYQTDSLQSVLQLIQRHYSIPAAAAKEKLAQLVSRIEETEMATPVQYKFYPSEIVRALEKGYLLEIQEPTVIRDASVLVALNSALEANGMLNIPTGIIQRHPDCVIVVTTNRNYQGNRPLNESLRDRMQHAEKMDLPPLEVMVERGIAKTGCEDLTAMTIMARIIRLLEETAKANAIKGVAGMRSYFYWVNTLKQGQPPQEAIYPKVLYKLTTDPDELQILESALDNSGLLSELIAVISGRQLREYREQREGRRLSSEAADERNITEEAEGGTLTAPDQKRAETDENEKKAENTAEHSDPADRPAEKLPDISEAAASDTVSQAEEGTADHGQEEAIRTGATAETEADPAEQERRLKKTLNRKARELLKTTIHAKEGLLIHRPQPTKADREKGRILARAVRPQVEEVVKHLKEILENQQSESYGKGKYTGTRFDASRVAYGDYRTFEKKTPPHDSPSLAIALRVDESGSMVREGRIETARAAAVAVAEFAAQLSLPLMIYGDTADLSQREKTSIYSYKEFSDGFSDLSGKLAGMKPRQNNRDGVPLRLLSEALVQETATTRLLISISDGQPKALPDYTGDKAKEDIQEVIREYERQGIIYLAAAIGEDQETIREIYGENRFLDISDLSKFPEELVKLLARYLNS